MDAGRTLLTLLSGSLILGGSAQAEGNLDYSYHDLDSDGLLTRYEFERYVHDAWDLNGDDRIAPDEFEFFASAYDTARLSDQIFTYWDRDRNLMLNQPELRAFLAENEIFDGWDQNDDRAIDRREFATATFMSYDLNSDGYISLNEWGDDLFAAEPPPPQAVYPEVYDPEADPDREP